jgi:hypothetical protein
VNIVLLLLATFAVVVLLVPSPRSSLATSTSTWYRSAPPSNAPLPSATYHETQHVSGHHCSPNKHLCPSHNSTHHGSPYRPLPVLSLGTFSTYSTSRCTSHSFGTENVSEVSRGRAREYPFTRNSIEDEFRKYSIKLTRKQNRHMRNSPPFQPGEQAYPDKLPSFSEVCYLLVL